MKAPELLSPAGTLKNMRYAFAYGADAVYAGQPRYSLRVRNNDFLEENLAKGIAEAHDLGKQFFVTANLMPHNSKVKSFVKDMQVVVDMQPDALIMADPGLIMLAREAWPDMPIHLSVQANTVNFAAVKFWQKIGVTRIILSRELSLEEIKEIRELCPDIELEVFVHGALCIAYSGRCLLSGYFNHRDPNQGTCTNSCRWDYKTQSAMETPEGKYIPAKEAEPVKIDMAALKNAPAAAIGNGERHPLADNVYFVEEANRPGELMPVMEDEHGTYIMNSKDLRAVEHVHELVKAGVDCLKIEGRTKSHYYVARTAQVYRQAIDDAVAGREFNPELLGVLENLANRGYTDGFYKRHHTQDYQNYMNGYSKSHQQQFVGEVMGYDDERGLAHIAVKNKFGLGDRLELVTPQGNRDFQIADMLSLQGEKMEVAPGGGYEVYIPMDKQDAEQALICRYL